MPSVEEQIASLMSRGATTDASDLTVGTGEELLNLNQPAAALELVSFFQASGSTSSLAPGQRAWVLNVQATALSMLGHLEEAKQVWGDMFGIGQEGDDVAITSTALLNLANVAFSVGDYDYALENYIKSLDEKLQINDQKGCLQINLNIAALQIEIGDFGRAKDLLASLGHLVTQLHDAHLTASFWGVQGSLAARDERYRDAESHFKRSLIFAKRTGDKALQITSLQNLSAACADQSRFGVALRWLRKAAAILASSDVTSSSVDILLALAVTLHRLGRNREARREFEEAQQAAETLGDRLKWAAATSDLGALNLQLGQFHLGRQLILDALEVFAATKSLTWQTRALSNLAIAAQQLGNFDEANDYLIGGLEALPLQFRLERSVLLRRLGELHAISKRDPSAAVGYFEQSLDEARATLERHELAWQAAEDATILASTGALQESLPFYSRALSIYGRQKNYQMMFNVRNDRAIALAGTKRLTAATRELGLCMSFANRLSNRAMRSQALMNLAEVKRQRGDAKDAVGLLVEALGLATAMEDPGTTAEILANLGLAYNDLMMVDQAEAVLHESRRLAEQLSLRTTKAHAIGGLATLSYIRGAFIEASQLYNEASKIWEREGNYVHWVEDLAGNFQSLCAIPSASRRARTAAQRLVDAAQEFAQEESASLALCRGARWFLKRNTRIAAEYYATAVALAASTLPEQEDDARIHRIVTPLMMTYFHLEAEAVDVGKFRKLLLRAMNEISDGFGNDLEDLLVLTWQQAAETAKKGSHGR